MNYQRYIEIENEIIDDMIEELEEDMYEHTAINYWNSVIGHYSDDEFKAHFRINRNTFDYLCDEIGPYIISNATRNKPTPQIKIAITIWRLATNCNYRTIADKFRVSKSSAIRWTNKVVRIISEKLLKKHIVFPTNPQDLEIAKNLFLNRKFPNCVGAIDGTHIPILAPLINKEDFFNRKGFYSINAMAVCDGKKRFIDISIGYPGKAHDAKVFRNSDLCNNIYPAVFSQFNQNTERLVLIGDAAYPSLPWLVKPWPGINLSPEKTIFNNRHSSARMSIEQAFGLLKSRWRILMKRQDTEFHHLHCLITACFILHNICINNNDNNLPTWNNDFIMNEIGIEPEIIDHNNDMRSYITSIL